MDQTEQPRNSVNWERVLDLVVKIVGTAAALATIVVLVLEVTALVRPLAMALAGLLIAVGSAQLCCAKRHPSRLPEVTEMRRRFGRLCVAVGILQLASSSVLPLILTTSTGALLFAAVLWNGMRHRPLPGKRKSRRVARAVTGILAPTVIAITVLAFACLAVATMVSKPESNDDSSHVKHRGSHEPGPESIVPGSEGEVTVASPTYAELCVSLPNPAKIGHDLGELFARDGAVKAGCGTPAVRVPGTGTWVSAGVCLGERRSVAISTPSHPAVIVYGEAAKFVLSAAQTGTLTAVEAATPAGGDVVLVETLTGTYGFARSTRSAIPGNEEARRCNEVGGVAEPFAQMPPPLVVLWRDLLRDSATWFWPTPDNADGGESVLFLSPGEAVEGVCESEESCRLESDADEPPRYEGPSFVTLAELREYMPPEESGTGG